MKKKEKKPRGYILDIVLCGVLSAAVFGMTFINLRLPLPGNGGLVHLGNIPLFLTALLFGRRKGAAAGAIGMGLFDVVGGWMLWAPFTFVIRGVMGWIIGAVAEKRQGKNAALNTLALVLGCVWMLAGYYAAEIVLYGNWIAPLGSIPGNLTQLAVGAVAAVPLASALKSRAVAGAIGGMG